MINDGCIRTGLYDITSQYHSYINNIQEGHKEATTFMQVNILWRQMLLKHWLGFSPLLSFLLAKGSIKGLWYWPKKLLRNLFRLTDATWTFFLKAFFPSFWLDNQYPQFCSPQPAQRPQCVFMRGEEEWQLHHHTDFTTDSKAVLRWIKSF